MNGISLIVDLIVLLFILVGFLWGLKRGLKKSVNRLLLLLIAFSLALILTPVLTNMLMNINLIGDPEKGSTLMSTNDFINSYFQDTFTVLNINGKHFTLTIQAITAIIKLFVNLISFILLFLFFKGISWIVYMIVMREPKYSKIEEERMKADGTWVNKRKWWGSLVGGIQGMFLFICFFIPISGVSSIISDMNSNTTSAQSNHSEISIINDLVPKDVQKYLNVYEDSIFNKLTGWTNIDTLIFNSVTTTRIDKVKLSLKNELLCINSTYIDLEKYGLIDAAINNELDNKISELSEAETKEILTATLNDATNFTLMKFILVDSSNAAAKSLDVEQNIRAKDVDWEAENTKLSDSLTDMVFSAKPVLVKFINNDTVTLDKNLIDEISEDNFAKLGRGMDKMKDITLLKNIYQPMFIKLFNSNQLVEFGTEIGFNFKNIDITTVVWEQEMVTFGKSIKLAVKLQNANGLNDVTGDDISEILDAISGSQIEDDFNNLIAQTLEDKYGITTPDDFSITGDDALSDATIDVIESLETVDQGSAVDSEKADELLNSLSSIPDGETSQALLDAFSAEAGIGLSEDKPTVTSVTTSAIYLNEFITGIDSDKDDDTTVTTASELATNLNDNPNNIKLLKFKSNTYLISQEKWDEMDSATNGKTNKEDIMSLFTVIGA